MELQTLVKMGHDILLFMSSIATKLTSPMSTLVPWDLSAIEVAVPILTEFLAYSILDVMLGVGLPLVLGYTLIKWIIP